MALKASEINEISTLGAMKTLVDQMQKAIPSDREIRKEWLEVIERAKQTVDRQWQLTDKFMSVDDT
jgi:hypothetical protein